MASGSTGFAFHSADLINGRWIIPSSVTGDAEFELLWTAYEGRSLSRYQRGERGSRSNIPLDIFLKLVTGQIKSTNPFNTLEQAIRFYGLCNSVREQDFDLLKHILDFLVQYKILTVEQRSRLRSEISLGIPAKREAVTIVLG
jgi:hypothetical protein